MEQTGMSTTNRRDLLKGAGALTIAGPATLLVVRPARATPESMQAAIDKVVGAAKISKGKVAIDIPPLVENGNVVPITVSVDSPMTAGNYVKALHVFNEKNPLPNVISVKLGPRAGKAAVSTRIRLATAQKIVAIAELSDGSFWSDSADVIVTVAACVEATL
jgi:sulfur-oxidizing protein SoxY